jgi:hypothetical protein
MDLPQLENNGIILGISTTRTNEKKTTYEFFSIEKKDKLKDLYI